MLKESLIELRLLLERSRDNKFTFQEEKIDVVSEKDLRQQGIVLKLPHTIRNISTKMTQSNSFMVSNNNTYAVAGVRYMIMFDIQLFDYDTTHGFCC